MHFVSPHLNTTAHPHIHSTSSYSSHPHHIHILISSSAHPSFTPITTLSFRLRAISWRNPAYAGLSRHKTRNPANCRAISLVRYFPPEWVLFCPSFRLRAISWRNPAYAGLSRHNTRNPANCRAISLVRYFPPEWVLFCPYWIHVCDKKDYNQNFDTKETKQKQNQEYCNVMFIIIRTTRQYWRQFPFAAGLCSSGTRFPGLSRSSPLFLRNPVAGAISLAAPFFGFAGAARSSVEIHTLFVFLCNQNYTKEQNRLKMPYRLDR